MKSRPSQAISRKPAQPVLQARQTEESSVRTMMQKLESMEHGNDANGHTGQNRWMVPYADLLTLLLGLFLVLFTASQKPEVHKTAEPQTPINTLAYTANQPQLNDANTSAIQTAINQAKQSTARDTTLTRQLRQTIAHNLHMPGIEVHQQMRGVVISLKDTILFAPGSAELTPTAHQTLSHLIQQIHTALGGQSRPIRVEGHTDNSPIATSKFPSNWELSTARATTIVRFLVNSHHFQPQMLSAAGYGEFKPLKDNSSIEGKQKNRRVDIVVLRPDMATDMPPDLNPNQPTMVSTPVAHPNAPQNAPKNGRPE